MEDCLAPSTYKSVQCVAAGRGIQWGRLNGMGDARQAAARLWWPGERHQIGMTRDMAIEVTSIAVIMRLSHCLLRSPMMDSPQVYNCVIWWWFVLVSSSRQAHTPPRPLVVGQCRHAFCVRRGVSASAIVPLAACEMAAVHDPKPNQSS